MGDPVKVVAVSELKAGECKTVMAGDRELALFNVGGKFYATDNICPHRGGPLGEGMLEDKVVTCPWHGWRFDVTNGSSPVIPGVKLDCFECHTSKRKVTAEASK